MKSILLATLITSSAFAAVIDDSDLAPDKRGIGPLGVQYSMPTTMLEEFKPGQYKNTSIVHNKKGNYQIFTSAIGDSSIFQSAQSKELFYGKRSDYEDYIKKEADSEFAKKTAFGAVNGLTSAAGEVSKAVTRGAGEALNAGLATMGIGILMAGLEMGVEKAKEDYYYYKVIEATDVKGSYCKLITMMVCDDDEYSAQEIRAFMAQKEKDFLK